VATSHTNCWGFSKKEEKRQKMQRVPHGTNDGQYRDNYDDKYDHNTYDQNPLPVSRQIEFPENERSEFETHEEFAERQRLNSQAREWSGPNGYDDEKRRYQQQVQQHQQDRSYNYIGSQQGPSSSSSWQQPPSYQQPPQTFYPGQDYPGKN